MSTEDRLSQLESSFVTVTRLLRSQSERMDTHDSWINELGRAQAETERKMAALIDAQIHTEDKLGRLEAAVTQLVGKVDQLADVVKRLAEGS